MASNLPPGVTVGMLPGNTKAERDWDALADWALDQLAGLDLRDARRAVLIGIAAVKADADVVREIVNDAAADANAARDFEEDTSG